MSFQGKLRSQRIYFTSNVKYKCIILCALLTVLSQASGSSNANVILSSFSSGTVSPTPTMQSYTLGSLFSKTENNDLSSLNPSTNNFLSSSQDTLSSSFRGTTLSPSTASNIQPSTLDSSQRNSMVQNYKPSSTSSDNQSHRYSTPLENSQTSSILQNNPTSSLMHSNQPPTTLRRNQPLSITQSTQHSTFLQSNQASYILQDIQTESNLFSNQPSSTLSSNEPSSNIQINQPSFTIQSSGTFPIQQSLQPSSMMQSNLPSQNIYSNQPSSTPRSNEPSSIIHSNQPSSTPRSNEPSSIIQSNQPSSIIQSSEIFPTQQSNQSPSMVQSNQPSQNLHSSQHLLIFDNNIALSITQTIQPSSTLQINQLPSIIQSIQPSSTSQIPQPPSETQSSHPSLTLQNEQALSTSQSEKFSSSQISSSRTKQEFVSSINQPSPNGLPSSAMPVDQVSHETTNGQSSVSHLYSPSYLGRSSEPTYQTLAPEEQSTKYFVINSSSILVHSSSSVTTPSQSTANIFDKDTATAGMQSQNNLSRHQSSTLISDELHPPQNTHALESLFISSATSDEISKIIPTLFDTGSSMGQTLSGTIESESSSNKLYTTVTGSDSERQSIDGVLSEMQSTLVDSTYYGTGLSKLESSSADASSLNIASKNIVEDSNTVDFQSLNLLVSTNPTVFSSKDVLSTIPSIDGILSDMQSSVVDSIYYDASLSTLESSLADVSSFLVSPGSNIASESFVEDSNTVDFQSLSPVVSTNPTVFSSTDVLSTSPSNSNTHDISFDNSTVHFWDTTIQDQLTNLSITIANSIVLSSSFSDYSQIAGVSSQLQNNTINLSIPVNESSTQESHQSVTSITPQLWSYETSTVKSLDVQAFTLDSAYEETITPEIKTSTPFLSSLQFSTLFHHINKTEPYLDDVKYTSLKFILDGDCAIIRRNHSNVMSLKNELRYVLKQFFNVTTELGRANFTDLKCKPFSIILQFPHKIPGFDNINISKLSSLQNHLIQLTLVDKNTTINIEIMDVQKIKSDIESKPGLNTLVNSVIISLAACICGILISTFLAIYIREVCWKNKFIDWKLKLIRCRETRTESVSLTGMPRSSSVHSEMKDNGSLASHTNPSFGVYSTVENETSFMKSSDLRRSSGRLGKFRNSLKNKMKSSKMRISQNGQAYKHGTQPDTIRGNHPYGLVIGLMGYQPKTEENIYAVPKKHQKKRRVYGLAIRPTPAVLNPPKDNNVLNTTPSKNVPVPPRRYHKRYLKHGEIRDSSENLVSVQKVSKSEPGDDELGVDNPAFGVYDSKSSLHI